MTSNESSNIESVNRLKPINNLPDNMNMVIIIDKEKLPEDVRKMIEDNLPKDV